MPAPYLARARWVALDEWSALSDREIASRVAAAYAIVRRGLTKKAQAALDPPARTAGATRRPRTARR